MSILHIPEAEGDPRQILRDVFNYPEFRGQQLSIINCIMQGTDALGVMPTGGGKSLCFQIPAMCLKGLTIVVSPLIALMRDQIEALRARGIRSDAFVSDRAHAFSSTRDIENALRSRELDIVYVSPERLSNPSFRRLTRDLDISLFAIDEAHCVSEWGQDFRPDYLGIPDFLKDFPATRRIALTASATPAVRREIITKLLRRDAREFVDSFKRPFLSLNVSASDDPHGDLKKSLSEKSGPAIVYCRTRNEVENLAEMLNTSKLRTGGYHAGIEGSQRSRIQDDFLAGEIDVVVATSAFGMGINKSDVRHVFHIGLPSSLESYYQETGRAGRDGLDASAHIFWRSSDIAKRTYFAFGAENITTKLRELSRLEQVLGFVTSPGCRSEAIVRRFGEIDDCACGKCDNCREPPALADKTDDVKAVLRVVRRLDGPRMSLVADILSGRHVESLIAEGYHRLPEYGRLRALGAAGTRHLERQCLGLGILEIRDDARVYPGPKAQGVETNARSIGLREYKTRSFATPTIDDIPDWRMTVWKELVEARRRCGSRLQTHPSKIASDGDLAQIVAALGTERNYVFPRGDDIFADDIKRLASTAPRREEPMTIDSGLF